MNMTERDHTHPSDGDLVRLIDRELIGGEATALEAHANACEECDDRIRELQALTAEWTRRSREEAIPIDEIARGRALAAVRAAEAARQRKEVRETRVRYRTFAAAAVVVLVLGSLTVGPVRAWVSERLGIATPPAAVLTEPAGDAAGAGMVVSFEPTEAEFRIDLEHSQSEGSLVLEASASELGSAEVVGRDAETLLLLPAGLLIENELQSTASYSVRLPPGTVERVQVLAGGSLLAEVELASFVDGRWAVLLGESRQ